MRGSDLHIDLIMNGRIGNVQPGRDGTRGKNSVGSCFMRNIKVFFHATFLTGSPMTVEYYISPLDVLMGLSGTGIETLLVTSNAVFNIIYILL